MKKLKRQIAKARRGKGQAAILGHVDLSQDCTKAQLDGWAQKFDPFLCLKGKDREQCFRQRKNIGWM